MRFHAPKNKGQFRDQRTIIHRARVNRNPALAFTAFDPSDTDFVGQLNRELGFQDAWLVVQEQASEDQQDLPDFMQRMQNFMGQFSGKRKHSSAPEGETQPKKTSQIGPDGPRARP